MYYKLNAGSHTVLGLDTNWVFQTVSNKPSLNEYEWVRKAIPLQVLKTYYSVVQWNTLVVKSASFYTGRKTIYDSNELFECFCWFGLVICFISDLILLSVFIAIIMESGLVDRPWRRSRNSKHNNEFIAYMHCLWMPRYTFYRRSYLDGVLKVVESNPSGHRYLKWVVRSYRTSQYMSLLLQLAVVAL